MKLLIILLTVVMLGQALSPSSYLAPADKARLKAVFDQGCTAESDMSSIYYSVMGLKLLGEAVNNKEQLCAAAAKLADDTSVENLFAATGTGAALGCPVKLSAQAKEALNPGAGATSASIYFSSKALLASGGKVSVSMKKALTEALKKDDSLLSLGLAFHVATHLDGDVTAILERVEDALVQADEVDGRMLQFEGGLSVTSLVLTGAATLSAKAKKEMPITGEQAVKFANYLLSRKSVQQPKGALHLLEGIEALSNPAAQFIPLTVSLASPLAVTADKPAVAIAVTDLKGSAVADLKVTVNSVTRVKDDKEIATNIELKKSGAGYELDLMALKPAAGFYELTVSAEPAKPNKKYVGNTNVVLTVKVLTSLAIKDVELKVFDSDQSSASKALKVQHPKKNAGNVEVGSTQKVQLTFTVVDGAGAKMLVHQAFVRLAKAGSDAEIVYVAESDYNLQYKFELDLAAEALEVKEAGTYSLTLILGDAVVSNPVSWEVADLALLLPEAGQPAEPGLYQLKPEIKHLFREPEKRPPQTVSTLFTLLCVAPLLLLAILWLKLGANISNFNFSLTTIGFHLGLGAIFLLYLFFWLKLNMFETVYYLAIIGLVTFLCGNSLLASIAKKNK